jgi:hypothetical protein
MPAGSPAHHLGLVSHGYVPSYGERVRTKTLMACVELRRTVSHKVNPDAFLFKATKVSKTTK